MKEARNNKQNGKSKMKIFKFKDGSTVDFEPFPVKDENSRKVNIHFNGKDREGIWACFSDKGVKEYNNGKSRGKILPCILVNTALFLYPNSSWGLYIPVKTNGTDRPDCDLSKLSGEMMFCDERIQADCAKQSK